MSLDLSLIFHHLGQKACLSLTDNNFNYIGKIEITLSAAQDTFELIEQYHTGSISMHSEDNYVCRDDCWPTDNDYPATTLPNDVNYCEGAAGDCGCSSSRQCRFYTQSVKAFHYTGVVYKTGLRKKELSVLVKFNDGPEQEVKIQQNDNKNYEGITLTPILVTTSVSDLTSDLSLIVREEPEEAVLNVASAKNRPDHSIYGHIQANSKADFLENKFIWDKDILKIDCKACGDTVTAHSNPWGYGDRILPLMYNGAWVKYDKEKKQLIAQDISAGPVMLKLSTLTDLKMTSEIKQVCPVCSLESVAGYHSTRSGFNIVLTCRSSCEEGYAMVTSEELYSVTSSVLLTKQDLTYSLTAYTNLKELDVSLCVGWGENMIKLNISGVLMDPVNIYVLPPVKRYGPTGHQSGSETNWINKALKNLWNSMNEVLDKILPGFDIYGLLFLICGALVLYRFVIFSLAKIFRAKKSD